MTPTSNSWWASLTIIFVLGLTLGALIHRREHKQIAPIVTISFLDLADGDCAVIHTPDNRYILIDAGGTNCKDEVTTALRKMGAHQIDLLVLASPEDTSIGGVPALVASGLPIRSVWNNAATEIEPETPISLGNAPVLPVSTDLDKRTVEMLAAGGIPIRTMHKDESVTIGQSGILLTVIWPTEHGDRSHLDALACRVDYDDESGLFLGPLSEEAEAYLVSGAGDELKADVLQVTDHGGGEGTTHELLRRVRPSIAVIACTSSQPPAPAAVDRLQAASAATYRTDIQGTVTVTLGSGPNTPEVETASQ